VRTVLLTVFVAASSVLADSEPRFEKLRAQAEALGSLSGFIQKYVGDCGAINPTCAKNAEAFRRTANNKKFHIVVNEETASLLQMADINIAEGTFLLNFTPFIVAGDSALTHGAPTKTDPNGNPVLPFIRVDSKFPDGWSPQLMTRQVQGRAMRLQLIFTPEGIWTIPKKGGGQIRGVRARFDAVFLQVGRTGDNVGIWFAR
jgi:hypothetical protein